MNYSKQRQAMLDILHNTRSHPTANDIYLKMRESDPKISLGTVYRNLSLLTENGIIQRIDTEHDSVHYDGFTHPHYHFVCNKCRQVMDIEIAQINVDKEVETKYECSVSGHSLIFYGVCKNCQMQIN